MMTFLKFNQYFQKTYQVNEAVYKEFPDKRKASPMPKEYIQYNGLNLVFRILVNSLAGKEVETDEEAVEYDLDDEVTFSLKIISIFQILGPSLAGTNQRETQKRKAKADNREVAGERN